MTADKRRTTAMAAGIPAAHARALGQVVANFNYLELLLATLIWRLLGVEQRVGQIVTSELSFKGLLNIFFSLARRAAGKDAAQLKELDALRKRLGDAEKKRNILVHSVWLGGSTPDTAMTLKYTAKAKTGWNFRIDSTKPPEDIIAVADEIAILAGEMSRLGFGR